MDILDTQATQDKGHRTKTKKTKLNTGSKNNELHELHQRKQ